MKKLTFLLPALPACAMMLLISCAAEEKEPVTTTTTTTHTESAVTRMPQPMTTTRPGYGGGY